MSDLINTILEVKDQGFVLNFRKDELGDSFSTRITVSTNSFTMFFEDNYIITDELLQVAGDEGLSIIIRELVARIRIEISKMRRG